MPENIPMLAMTSGGPHAWIMINELRQRFGDFPIILEDEEPASTFWRRRRKMLGPLKTASMQAARLPLKLTKRGTGTIINEMIDEYDLNPHEPVGANIIRVSSINDPKVRETLRYLNPKAIFVVSTRMISKKILSCTDSPFINYHSGINPAYRGMFGGYFALANREPDLFGATVHMVDKGVDTGDILYQSRVSVRPGDNFHTYLWRIAAGSRGIVVKAISDALNEKLKPRRVDMPSRQYFAPTFGGYIWTGLTRRVW